MIQNKASLNALHTLHGEQSAFEFALSYLQTAQRELCYWGPTLNAALFNHQEMIELLSQLARSSSRAKLRFLIHASRHDSASGHRLLPLAQKLSSTILIHQSAPEDNDSTDFGLLVDNHGYLQSLNGQPFLVKADLNDRVKHVNLKRIFESRWSRSLPDPNIRRLTL